MAFRIVHSNLVIVSSLICWNLLVQAFIPLQSLSLPSKCSSFDNDNIRSILYVAQIDSKESPSDSPNNESKKEEIEESEPSTLKINSDKTLYEILNSSPDATRSELKRNYIALVRQTHPDAQINKEGTASDDENPEFQEIMIAWRTLSSPLERKRYDRTLRAKEFSTKVENVVENFGRKAGPQFLNAFENIAIPFLRRSAATTVAGFTSISEDLANYGSSNTTSGEETGLGGIIVNAVKSGQKAGKAIDSLELMEKSKELSLRCVSN